MSLYQKYRPTSLSEMVGNQDNRSGLEALLSGDNPPHALLFTGSSGTGKTTAARIVKDMLHCGDMDYQEVDSADFRGIDSIREIRRNSRLKPISGACRVWLLDECHQLSKDAQNALLKALEDPSPHAYFILATTDPEKLLKTIQTRCVRFDWQPLSERHMNKLLTSVSASEGVELPEEVCEQITLDSMGSARQALVILEKILHMPESKMLKAAQQQASKLNQTIELCRCLMKRESWSVISGILQGLQKEEPERVRRAIMGYCRAILLKSPKCDERVAMVLTIFRDTNLFDSGFDGLVSLCTEVYLEG